MPREAGLFESANGSVVEAYYLLRKGGANIPPNWINRASASRKNREKGLGKLLRAKSLDAVTSVNNINIFSPFWNIVHPFVKQTLPFVLFRIECLQLALHNRNKHSAENLVPSKGCHHSYLYEIHDIYDILYQNHRDSYFFGLPDISSIKIKSFQIG